MSKKRKQNQRRSSTRFLFLCTATIVLGSLCALLWQQRQTMKAADLSIVGPPSLSIASVEHILANTPMAGTGSVIVQQSRQYQIDDAFALAVWQVETSDGAAGVGINNHNPGGVQGSNGYIVYSSYTAGVIDWFSMLQQRYISRGLTTVYSICGPYVGTSGANTWAGEVTNLMQNYRGISPAPIPTVPPTSIPAATPTLIATVPPTPTPRAQPAPIPGQDRKGVHIQQPQKAHDEVIIVHQPISKKPLVRPAAVIPTATASNSTGFILLLPLAIFAIALAFWSIRKRKKTTILSQAEAERERITEEVHVPEAAPLPISVPAATRNSLESLGKRMRLVPLSTKEDAFGHEDTKSSVK